MNRKRDRVNRFEDLLLKPVKLTKQDLREMEEFVADVRFTDGATLSKGIPWKEFSEREVQGILKIHFEVLGYDVTWRHEDDPANERGIDLECKRESDDDKILVSVKKRPRKEALGQVVELSYEPGHKRVYVYLGGASQSFRDKIPRFKRKVEFWNEEILEKRLSDTGLTLSMKVDNSLTKRAMFDIMRKLVWAIKTEPSTKAKSLSDIEVLDMVWGMKDRAVTFHRCAGMAQLMFEDPSRFGELNHNQIQRLLIWSLDYIYANGLVSLRNTFDPMSPELHARLYKVYQKTKVRSNWGDLFMFKREFVPGTVESTVREYEENREKWKDITSRRKVGKEDLAKHGGLDEAANEMRILGIWAGGFEATIDDLFRDAVRPGLPPDPQLRGR